MKNISNKIKKETFLYLVFGVLTTIVDYAVAMFLFHGLHTGELTANNVAWCASVLFAYLTNKLLVFEAKSFEFHVICKEILTFVSARVITLLMADVIIWGAAHIGISFLVSKLLSSILVVIANYIFSKFWIFK